MKDFRSAQVMRTHARLVLPVAARARTEARDSLPTTRVARSGTAADRQRVGRCLSRLRRSSCSAGSSRDLPWGGGAWRVLQWSEGGGGGLSARRMLSHQKHARRPWMQQGPAGPVPSVTLRNTRAKCPCEGAPRAERALWMSSPGGNGAVRKQRMPNGARLWRRGNLHGTDPMGPIAVWNGNRGRLSLQSTCINTAIPVQQHGRSYVD